MYNILELKDKEFDELQEIARQYEFGQLPISPVKTNWFTPFSTSRPLIWLENEVRPKRVRQPSAQKKRRPRLPKRLPLKINRKNRLADVSPRQKPSRNLCSKSPEAVPMLPPIRRRSASGEQQTRTVRFSHPDVTEQVEIPYAGDAPIVAEAALEEKKEESDVQPEAAPVAKSRGRRPKIQKLNVESCRAGDSSRTRTARRTCGNCPG